MENKGVGEQNGMFIQIVSQKDFDDDRIDISFDTAWSPPLEWLKKASKIFKNLFFRIHYKEEGMGYEGVAKVNNGKLEDKYIEY